MNKEGWVKMSVFESKGMKLSSALNFGGENLISLLIL